MDEELRSLLDEEIKRQIEDLSSLESGSKEKSVAIEDLAELYKLRIEETKTQLEYEEKRERRSMESDKVDDDARIHAYEEELKRDQLTEQVKERYFRVGIAAAEIVLPMIFYAFWMRKGFKFEETGTYTSTTFKGLFSRFRPTKK